MAEGTASFLALAYSPPFNIQGDPAGRLFFLASGLRGAGVEVKRLGKRMLQGDPAGRLFFLASGLRGAGVEAKTSDQRAHYPSEASPVR